MCVKTEALLSKAVARYLWPDAPSMKWCHLRLMLDVERENAARVEAGLPWLTCPTYDRLMREIGRLSPVDAATARHGRAAAHRRFAAPGGRS